MRTENGALESIQKLNEKIGRAAERAGRRLENLSALTTYLEGSNNNEMPIDASMLNVITEYLKGTIAMEDVITDSTRAIRNNIRELMETGK